jgi:hypothetical protein
MFYNILLEKFVPQDRCSDNATHGSAAEFVGTPRSRVLERALVLPVHGARPAAGRERAIRREYCVWAPGAARRMPAHEAGFASEWCA